MAKEGFQPGNQFWRRRTRHGRDSLYKSADELWEACCEYFEWIDKNPLSEQKAFSHAGLIIKTDLPKMRAMTISGLCIHLDIAYETWRLWSQKGHDFFEVTTAAAEIIRQQKFEGAAADLLNANIISRDLGLSEKTEVSIPQAGRRLSDFYDDLNRGEHE